VAWQDDDILRSVRRYLAMTLDGPPWKLRVERREVKDEDRPVAVVTSGPLVTTRSRSARFQGNVEEAMPITISLYPELGSSTVDGIRAGRLVSSMLKAQVKELLDTGLTVTTGTGVNRRHWAGPFVLPLWDYEDVDLTGEDKAGPEDPHDVLWVDDKSLNVQAIQDPEDARRWSVIANFRISVERPGRVPDESELMDVDRLVGHYEPPPG
jgi:hypothetical protein